jgi:hypothetical protein
MSQSSPVSGSAEVRDMIGSIPELWGGAGHVTLPDAAFDAIARVVTKALDEARGHAQSSQQWQPIETAPKDGSQIIGLWKCNVYSLRWTKYYEKWPHQDGGPTFRGGWSVETWDQHMPCEPSHWMPMPQTLADTSTDGNSK